MTTFLSRQLATLLLEQFGEAEAARYVVDRMAASQRQQDLERRRHWRLVMSALENMLMEQQQQRG